jgi:hypothetical protein
MFHLVQDNGGLGRNSVVSDSTSRPEPGVFGSGKTRSLFGIGMKQIFVNRYGELRAGWKILLFFILTSVLIALLGYPIQLIRKLPMSADFEGLLDPLAGILALIGSLAGSYVLTRFVNRKPLRAIGLWFLGSSVRELTGGIVISFLMMGAIACILVASGFVDMHIRSLSALDVLFVIGTSAILFASGAMVEEVLFRGYPFQTLIQGITLLPAVLLMGITFGAAHIGNPNATVFAIANIVMASIWLSIAYLKTRGLWLPFGLHFGWNFAQTVVFSFPTSGIEFSNRRLFETVVTGPEWLTGGSFGPEGGVLATAALIAGSWYLLKTNRFSPPPGVTTLDSIEDLIREKPLAGGDAA